jgi:indole-3-acetate monooxygenase
MSAAAIPLKSVEQIEPIIRAHAAAAERERRLAAPVAEALRDAGLYRLWRPRSLGGFELDPIAGFQVLEEVSRIDSAAGWNLQIASAFDMFGQWFDEPTARELFGRDAIIGGALNPPRRAVPSTGGYRLSGRTPFVSGAHQATAFLGLANVFENGEMRIGANGAPETLLTICRASEAEIISNWNTMGMSGTGSHDVNLEGVFVSQQQAVPLVPIEKRTAYYEGPLYRLTIWPSVAAMAPIALGIARAALDEAIRAASQKAPAYTAKALRDRSVVQAELARAEAAIGSSRAYLYEVFEEAWDLAVADRPIAMEWKGRMQLAATHAVLEAAEAVDLVHAVVGSSGIREEQPFSRHFRDAHVITQHGFVNASKLESVGQILLGLSPEWPFFAL